MTFLLDGLMIFRSLRWLLDFNLKLLLDLLTLPFFLGHRRLLLINWAAALRVIFGHHFLVDHRFFNFKCVNLWFCELLMLLKLIVAGKIQSWASPSCLVALFSSNRWTTLAECLTVNRMMLFCQLEGSRLGFSLCFNSHPMIFFEITAALVITLLWLAFIIKFQAAAIRWVRDCKSLLINRFWFLDVSFLANCLDLASFGKASGLFFRRKRFFRWNP